MKKKPFLSILLLVSLVIMLVKSDLVADGARNGLLLWYQSVVPVLFPFMVISGLIITEIDVELMMTPLHRLISFLFPISKYGCYVLTTGLLCGYPMGAKTCADFLTSGKISEEEARFLLAVCNHPSPMYLLGYVAPYFSSEIQIWKLLLSIYSPALIVSLFASRCYLGKPGLCGETKSNTNYNKHSRLTGYIRSEAHSSIDDTIMSSVSILCKIGGYLVLFSIMIVFIRNAGWMPTWIRLLLILALEMTTGVKELVYHLPIIPAFVCSAGALSFGGISGVFQTKAVLAEKKAGLSIRPYILWKLMYAVISVFIAAILCSIF